MSGTVGKLGVVLVVLLAGLGCRGDYDDGGGTGGSESEAGDGDGDGDGDGNCDPVSHSCQPVVPQGWAPVHVFPGLDPADCSDPTVAGTGIDADPATCPQCECTAPTGGTCTQAHVELSVGASSCAANPTCSEMADLGSGECLATLLCGNPTYANGITVAPIEATGASCAPQALGDPMLGDPSFTEPRTLCAVATSDGCDAGETCRPNPPNGFLPRHCVFASGDQQCPIEYPHAQPSLFAGFDDTRDCQACGCGDVEDRTCPGDLTRFADGGCPMGQGFPENYTPGVCSGLTNVKSVSLSWGGPTGGTCAPSGGTPTGDVTATDPVTVCCTQP